MKNLRIAATLSLLALGSSGAFAQTASPWQMHEGTEGIVAFPTPGTAERQAAFAQARIPQKNDGGWQPAPVNGGKVDFARASKLSTCLKELDFTYFQTTVNIPANVTVDKFSISYDKADDGARLYFFNSNNNGTFDPAADLLGAAYKEIDLKGKVAVGENRIVIVQYDNCATRNTMQGIHLKLNGTEIKPVVPEAGNNAGGITVYEHVNYGGKSRTLAAGTHDITSTDFNDIISSVKIPRGWKVTLFQDWKTTGNKVVLTADNADLESIKFNDLTSSIIIEKL